MRVVMVVDDARALELQQETEINYGMEAIIEELIIR